jgi:uncharacterized membrane protein YeaQ/YmgE (transglycosylase-associated protein family)
MGMGICFIGWIVIGALAGFIAEKIMKRDHGLVTNLIVGVIGAILGGWILGLFIDTASNGWIMSLITAVIGACVLLWIVGLIRSKSAK